MRFGYLVKNMITSLKAEGIWMIRAYCAPSQDYSFNNLIYLSRREVFVFDPIF